MTYAFADELHALLTVMRAQNFYPVFTLAGQTREADLYEAHDQSTRARRTKKRTILASVRF
jgi:hypothetical protein